MDGVKEAFEIVFGEEFVNEMTTRILIIACSLAVVGFIIIAALIWKSVACRKIKKAILSLSEHPDDKQAELFVKRVSKVSSLGKFIAKHSEGYSGLSKGDCRIIYNSTVLASTKMGKENKKSIRNYLMKIGCDGLTEIDSI